MSIYNVLCMLPAARCAPQCANLYSYTGLFHRAGRPVCELPACRRAGQSELIWLLVVPPNERRASIRAYMVTHSAR